MNQDRNRNQIGEQIKAAVQEGLATGDFKQFNAVVNDTVNQALRDGLSVKTQKQPEYGATQKAAGNKAGNAAAGHYTHPAYAEAAQKKLERERQKLQQEQLKHQLKNQVRSNAKPAQMMQIRMNKVGNVASILYMTFGGIGIGVTAILLVIFLSLLFVTGNGIPVAISGGLFAGFFAMLQRGCSKRNLLKRAQRYMELCGTRSYINIEDLAAHMGKSRREILKDVRKMIRLNIYPEGHLDSAETCLMLNDATFQEYLKLEKERKVLEQEQKAASLPEQKSKKQKKTEAAVQEAERKEMDPLLADMIQEGNEYIRKLREMNDVIPGEAISRKLFGLERLLQEIFERLKEHPEQMPQMQKFMSYYLPTTLKLVEAYAEFDAVSVQGEEIQAAKTEIEATLDTINKAFAELLNKLFSSTVYDVTTDAQVLQTMLSRDGLTGNGVFEEEKERS